MSSISPGPASPTPSFVLKNVTIDDTDSSLKYSQGWNRSVSSPAFGGSFQSTDRIGEVVSFSLPANAVALYYIGFKQSSGALYEACLDCSTKNSNNVDVIDGHTDGRPSSEPTLLYQKTNLDPSVRHSLALLNVPDSRFGNTSTITVDAFLVTVADDVQSSTTTTTSMMSSMSGMSLIAMNPTSDNQDVPSSTSPPDIQVAPLTSIPYPSSTDSMNTASQNQNDLSPGQRTAQKMRSPLVITGVILGTLFIVFTALFALMYFMRRRKRKMTAPVMTEGHWAARFFGDKGRTEGKCEGWLDRQGARIEAGTAMGGDVKIAKGTMVEQLVPDRPTYASLPSRTTPPPLWSAESYRQQWVAPSYHPYNATQGTGRTIPRSAFPFPPAGPPPQPLRTQQLARGPSANSTHSYSRSSSPGPGFDNSPTMPMNSHSVSNPYVAEARARVRDRARGITKGGWYGPEQANNDGYVAQYEPAAAYGIGYGNGGPDNARLGNGTQRNDSWGGQYAP